MLAGDGQAAFTAGSARGVRPGHYPRPRAGTDNAQRPADAPALDGTSFRVLIAGPRHFTDYPALRPTPDALLVNRLPDVELLTCWRVRGAELLLLHPR
jgi:hypothetical protein